MPETEAFNRAKFSAVVDPSGERMLSETTNTSVIESKLRSDKDIHFTAGDQSVVAPDLPFHDDHVKGFVHDRRLRDQLVIDRWQVQDLEILYRADKADLNRLIAVYRPVTSTGGYGLRHVLQQARFAPFAFVDEDIVFVHPETGARAMVIGKEQFADHDERRAMWQQGNNIFGCVHVS